MSELDTIRHAVSRKHERYIRTRTVDSFTKLFGCDRTHVERLIIEVHPAKQKFLKSFRNDCAFND